MEDQDRETRIDEDDEGEDVEGHKHKTVPDKHKLANDEGDDVEGHWHKHAPAKHKA
jgi:hypothetical protein